MKKFFYVVAATALLSLPVSAAKAEWQPSGPVNLIVPAEPGGGADFVSRLLADKMSEIWDVPVVVQNRGGAAGRIGTQYAIRAEPDGQTILFAQNSLVIWPAVYFNMPFDVQEELIPTAMISHIPLVITMNPDVPAGSLSELVDHAREHPGELNYTSNGVGSHGHLVFSLFMDEEDIEMQHVPYPGAAARVTAMTQGEVQLDMGSVQANLGAIEAGNLKALAVSTPSRVSAIPDVPTVTEAGFPYLEISAWNGIFLPAGASDEVVEAVNKVVVEALEDPELVATLEAQGQMANATSSAEFRELFNSEAELYQRIAESAGIEKSDAQR